MSQQDWAFVEAKGKPVKRRRRRARARFMSCSAREVAFCLHAKSEELPPGSRSVLILKALTMRTVLSFSDLLTQSRPHYSCQLSCRPLPLLSHAADDIESKCTQLLSARSDKAGALALSICAFPLHCMSAFQGWQPPPAPEAMPSACILWS